MIQYGSENLSRVRKFRISAASFCVTALVSGCSLGLFGDGKDQDALKIPSYHEINKSCAGLDLSRPEMDVVTFRHLLACFNSQGALEPIQQLVDKLSDEQVNSLIQVS